MSTIQTKGSYKRVENFTEKGGDIFSNRTNNAIFKLYHQHLIDLENKPNTMKSKLLYIVYLEQFLSRNGKTFKKIDREDVYNYINECSKLKWSLLYQDNNKFQIKLFLNWTYDNKFSEISGDMVLPKIVWHQNSNIRTYYSKDEIIKLLNAIDVKTTQGKEDYLMISLICYLGLRISDVINLKLSDINFNENTISIIQYKTDNVLFLPLINEVKYPLIDYLKHVRPADATDIDFIFITDTKPYRNKAELKTYNHKIKDYFIKAGVNINGRKHGFHALRHSFSTLLLSENASLYSISNILGHQQLNTTMMYLNIDTSKLKELALEVPYVK